MNNCCPRGVTEADIAQANLILVMDRDNFQAMEQRFPTAMPRTTTLGLFQPNGSPNIADPYLGTPAEALRVANQISRCIEGLASLVGEETN